MAVPGRRKSGLKAVTCDEGMSRPRPSAMAGAKQIGDDRVMESTTTVSDRPFGAHIRMAWWKPIALIVILAVAMLSLQFVLTGIADVVEVRVLGKDPGDTTLRPLTLLAANVSLALVAPIAILLVARFGRTSWKEVLRTGRSFSWKDLATYAAIFAVLVGTVFGASKLFGPEGGSAPFSVSTTTIALLVVAVLTTPLQAAAEEIIYRGAVMPAMASCVRAVRPALVLGLIASSLLFSLSHASGDPWLVADLFVFGACTVLMAVITGGLEAPIAFHIMNNLIGFCIDAFFTGGGGIDTDSSASGGPYMLVFIALNLVALGIVWVVESRRRAELSPHA